MVSSTDSTRTKRLPSWLRRKIPLLNECARVEGVIRSRGLNTICREGLCPNRAECYARSKVTFMMLGDTCTRDCAFCSVRSGHPSAPDPGEPAKIAGAARELGLKHVIVTSVTRDDLPDGGSGFYAKVIEELKKCGTAPVVEVLIPDFKGDLKALERVMRAGPDIISHNLETIKRLYRKVRRGADYERSLRIISEVKKKGDGIFTKSALMLGLGESEDEVLQTMSDLREAECDFLAVGQYLRPGKRQVPVRDFISPERFSWYEQRGYALGFREVTAGPLVRSSYQENRVAKSRKGRRAASGD